MYRKYKIDILYDCILVCRKTFSKVLKTFKNNFCVTGLAGVAGGKGGLPGSLGTPLLSCLFARVSPSLTSCMCPRACLCVPVCVHLSVAGAVLGKNIWGAWPLIIREATTAKPNYYRTNYIKHVEKLGLNYPGKIWEAWQDLGAGACAHPGPNVEPPLVCRCQCV